MSTIELLFIRACKSCRGRERVLNVYRRFYYRYPQDEALIGERDCAIVLLNLTEKFRPITAPEMLAITRPDGFFDSRTYWQRLLDGVISHIALTRMKYFPDYIAPTGLRRRMEKSS